MSATPNQNSSFGSTNNFFASPTTPLQGPTHASPFAPSPSVARVPKISFNFRVQDVTAADPVPDDVLSRGESLRSVGASPSLSSRDDHYNHPYYYVGYSGPLLEEAASSVRSTDSLPYWALPSLPIGVSDTPRLVSDTPSSMSAMDTARNDECMQAWRRARCASGFRSRVVLNTSAERSTVDLEAANMPWNERFQSLLEMPCFTPQDAASRANAIQSLQEEFKLAVLPIVETILMERDAVVRTVPLRPLGGVAGGDKYVCGNIVVKLAHSQKMMELYSSHDRAMKSVANELKGLDSLARGDIPLLHYPLGMMVRFFGFCAWACAKIPIAESTLRSGSRDGGRNVVEAADPGARAIMEALGKALNLKSHRVGKDRVEICGPVDLEIHCGLDGRYYALDTARLMPPDGNPLFSSTPNFYLYRSLRAELLCAWPDPLSSDALSPFGRDRRSEHDEDVMKASISITSQRIPALCQDIEKIFRQVGVRDNANLSAVLHARGINVRYIATLLDAYLRHCNTMALRPHQPFVTHAAAEICSRCFATVVRRDLLDVAADASASLSAFHTLLVERFNHLLVEPGEEGAHLWQRICDAAKEKYAAPEALQKRLLTLRAQKGMALANVSEEFFHRALFKRSSEILGVRWNVDDERDAAMMGRLGVPGTQSVFNAALILDVLPRTKMCRIEAHPTVRSLIADCRLPEAEQRLAAELRVRASVLGETPAIVPQLHTMAELFAMPAWGSHHPRLADALAYSERAVRIFQRMKDSRDEAIARANEECRMRDAAERAYTDDGEPAAVEQVQPVAPLPVMFFEGYVASLANHGRLLREAGRARETLDVISTALALYSAHGVDNKTLCASLHSSQSLTWRRLGRAVEAHESARAAAAVAESLYLTQRTSFAASRFAEALCLLAESMHELGFRQDAQKTSRDALSLVQIRLSDVPSSPMLRELLGDSEEPSTPTPAILTTSVQAVVLGSWIEVRLDGLTLQDSPLPTSAVLRLLIEAKAAVVEAFGQHSAELLRLLMLEARLSRLNGLFMHGIHLCNEARELAKYLYGDASLQECELLVLLAEFSFLPLMEQKPERLDTTDVESVAESRYHVAAAYLKQATSTLRLLDAAFSPLYAYADTLLADIARVSPDSTPAALVEGLSIASRAVATLQGLQMHNSPKLIYALNVASVMRINANPLSVVIPDLFRALASSDRFMEVANSDFYTQESIAYCQSKNKQAPGARYRVVLSRDGLLRKLSGLLQLTLLLLSHDELVQAALVAKGVGSLFRELFPPSSGWQEECGPLVRLMHIASSELLRRTGSVLGPVTEIGGRLREMADEVCTWQRDSLAAADQRARSAEIALAQAELRQKHERLLSQAKQVGTYFGTRAFANGFALLHPLLDNFAEMYPNGATPSDAVSVAVHNSIVQHILFARSCIEGSDPNGQGQKLPALVEDLLQAEDHVVEALQEAVHIDDAAAFVGWATKAQPSRQLRVDETISQYKIGFEMTPGDTPLLPMQSAD